MSTKIESIKKYIRATNYLAAAQIYLQDNFLLEKKLESKDIKPRLLGHWGTAPGINFVYAHLNRLITDRRLRMMFIMGPGHGFAALQANLFLEGTLGKYYEEATHTREGTEFVIKNFSWPYGFPSHSSPGAPGVIVEGGELGYALATAYGSVLDNPELITVCVVGDGEAETGPTATAWHINKLIDPKTNGAVLPIVHLNEYKISGPTLYGRMSERELKALFTGYGYEPIIVKGRGQDIHEKMVKALDYAADSIASIQEAANKEDAVGPYRFPVIILKTLKGWTGPKRLHGEKIEGNFLSHQVVGKETKTNAGERRVVEKWLRSYDFNELFDPESGFSSDIKSIIPDEELRMGDTPYVMRKNDERVKLNLPPADMFSEDATIPGTIGSSSMRRAGEYLNEVFKRNKNERDFRLFSPDETYSNKLDKVFETTARAYPLPLKKTDRDMSPDGRVMEMLSEHSLQGLMQGYVLTGRHGIFASYEAFIQIVGSMADQYAKFLRVSQETSWRGDVPSFNYILTSSGWRQEHNGFSHQNPGFIDSMLQKQGCFVRVYFPPDGNSTLACLRHCLHSKNGINVIVAGKTLEPRWLTTELAEKEMERGMMIWDFASDSDPDVVVAAVGDYLTKEALAAIDIVKTEVPDARLRFVNIMELSALGIGDQSCHSPTNDFHDYFTNDKPVIFNFHGYPQTLKQILFDYGDEDNSTRFSVHGYIESGSTTTPFDMQVRNKTSRYHLAIEIFERLHEKDKDMESAMRRLVQKYEQKLTEHRIYAEKYGVDPKEIEEWQWGKTRS